MMTAGGHSFWSSGLGLTSGQRSQLYIHDPASGVTTPHRAALQRLQALPWKGGRIPPPHRCSCPDSAPRCFIWDAASENPVPLEQDRCSRVKLSLRTRRFSVLPTGLAGGVRNGDYTIPRRRNQAAPPPQPSCVVQSGHRQSPGAGETWHVCGDTLDFPLHRGPGQPD